jgi:hypothetical protein
LPPQKTKTHGKAPIQITNQSMLKIAPKYLFTIFLLITGCNSGESVPAKKLWIKIETEPAISKKGTFSERILQKGDTIWVVDAKGTSAYVHNSLVFNDPDHFNIGGKSDSVGIHFLHGFPFKTVELKIKDSTLTKFRSSDANHSFPTKSIRIKRPGMMESLTFHIEGYSSISTQFHPRYDNLAVNWVADTIVLTFHSEDFIYF